MKICIIGDEWGSGEFGFVNNKYYGILHTGLEQYLRDDNYQVVNLSKRHASNQEIYQIFLDTTDKNFNCILYFQTDPLRDYRNDYDKILKDTDTLISFYNTALHDMYKKLNSIGLPVYIIGGSSKVNNDYLTDYPNLHVLVPSVMEMCSDTLVHPKIWTETKLVNKLLVDYDLYDENMITFICQEKLLQDALMEPSNPSVEEYFHPDGKQANRNAHLLIYQKVKELINIL